MEIDWKAIEQDYRAGKSSREIGAAHGVSHTAVLQHARAEGWTRVESQPAEEAPDDTFADVASEVANGVAVEPAQDVEVVATAVATPQPFDPSPIDIPRHRYENLSRPVREQLARTSIGEIDALNAAELGPLRERLDTANAAHARAAAAAAAARENVVQVRDRIPAAEAQVTALEAERPRLQARFAVGQASAEELDTADSALQLARQAVDALRGAIQPLEQSAKDAQRPVGLAADRVYEAEQALRDERADLAIRLAEQRVC